MSQPAVTITEQDGALGILPPTAGRLFALCGVSSSGTVNAPAAYARVKDVVATFGSGPLVEAACLYIQLTGKAVLLTRTGNSVAASVTAVTSVATGTSVVTISSSPTPYDDYEFALLIVAGGTRGTAGITYQLSLDGGRTYGSVTALGTGTTIDIPGAGGVTWAIAAGTLVAGDLFTARATAAMWNSTEITAALTALGNSIQSWELVHIVGALTASTFDAVDLAIAGMQAAGKPHAWIGSMRVPNIAESESAYKTAMDTIFSAKSTLFGMLCSGAAKITSAVSGRKYKRPTAFAIAAREASVSEEVDTANVNLGPLVGVSIRDSNGNVDEHDESVNPGLDDSRYAVLRTWDGLQGVYINRPRMFSPDGSDFQLLPHRRVMSLGEIALRAFMIRRLNRPIRVNKNTGFILESEALEIEHGARTAMSDLLLAKPKASDVQFALSRTDNLLSTKTLTGDARITPLGYPEFINLTIGFYNPALQVQTA
jgi:Protein of unknown function (DUF2586).